MKRFRVLGITKLEIEAENEHEAWQKAMKTAPMMWQQPIIEKVYEVDINGRMQETELPEDHDG